MSKSQKELAMKVWLYQVRGIFSLPLPKPPGVTQLYLSPEEKAELTAKKTVFAEKGFPVILATSTLDGIWAATVWAIFGENKHAVADICEFFIQEVKILGTQDIDVGGPKSFPKA